MTSPKKAFGQFVSSKRQHAGLTQRDLAERLYVTESAVSKWERGVSYPDIGLVAALATHLGVSEGELIHASEDPVAAQVAKEARFYRGWRSAILWTTGIAYLLTLVTTFIVNLAVEQRLDWFWVVLASLGVAFSLTTLPLLLSRHRLWLTAAAFIASLFAVLIVSWLLYERGEWLPIALASVAFAAVVLLSIPAVTQVPVPLSWRRHRTLGALALITIAYAVFLPIVMIASGNGSILFSQAIPISALVAILAWVSALVAVYLPVAGLYRAAIVVAFVATYNFYVLNPAIARLSGERVLNPVNLARWHDPYINGNVSLLVLLGCLLLAAVLALAGALRHRSATI